MHIRKAIDEDLNSIIAIYKTAQDFMIESGNPDQWGRTYPSRDLIENDIENEKCFLICDDDGPHGVFALFFGKEPTYEYIENGEWLNEDEYVTIHRIASDGTVKGIFKFAIDYCKGISENIRIDTHNSNKVMQILIEKNGFEKCGTIFVRESPRIAYQWSKQ